jgi:hypothetical protein
MKMLWLGCLALVLMAGRAPAAVLITEVAPWGSDAPYAADWFELTNTGPADVNLTGWRMDDSSGASGTGAAVALRGVTTLPVGKSAIFFESNASGSNDASITTNFINFWFGGTAPAGFLIGAYGGSGVGLSSSGDGVYIFDSSSSTPVANVSFGAATAGVSFDNRAGLNNTTISTLSVAGVGGAFTTGSPAATGSPGTAVPEPAGVFLAGLGGVAFIAARRRARLAA